MNESGKRTLTAFCFTDIHNQQAMLDYPTTLRSSFVAACDLAVAEFGKADLAINGGDNVSDYPDWTKSCALPKKNFLDLKAKLGAATAGVTKDGKALYVSGNNDMILGDIGTADNAPYNTTDFYDFMDESLGVLRDSEKLVAHSSQKPGERYLNAFHYVIGGFDFIGIDVDPDSAFNTHDGIYTDETLRWVKAKTDEIDRTGYRPIFVVGHLSAGCYQNKKYHETFDGNVPLFYEMFKGHRNAFYLYGHIHGESCCYKDYSSGAVIHLKNAEPLDINLASLDNRGKKYDYTFVHMGGLRPFGDEYFLRDGLTGYGGKPEKEFYLKTGTPTLAQYLVFVADEEKVTFYIRNTGSEPGYTPSDKPKPYVVYYQKPRG